MMIITNNPKINIEYSNSMEIEFYEDMDQLQILKKARDYIHMGAKLIMHPMVGRIKPHETPYKSVFLEKCEGELDFMSLTIIEDSIAETVKLIENTVYKKYFDDLLPDLQYIDYLLITSGIEEIRH